MVIVCVTLYLIVQYSRDYVQCSAVLSIDSFQATLFYGYLAQLLFVNCMSVIISA